MTARGTPTFLVFASCSVSLSFLSPWRAKAKGNPIVKNNKNGRRFLFFSQVTFHTVSTCFVFAPTVRYIELWRGGIPIPGTTSAPWALAAAGAGARATAPAPAPAPGRAAVRIIRNVRGRRRRRKRWVRETHRLGANTTRDQHYVLTYHFLFFFCPLRVTTSCTVMI